MAEQTPDDLAKALGASAPDLADQGDIAADDAGGTAMAERVAKALAAEDPDEAE